MRTERLPRVHASGFVAVGEGRLFLSFSPKRSPVPSVDFTLTQDGTPVANVGKQFPSHEMKGNILLSLFVIIVVTYEGGAAKGRMSHDPVWQHCINTSVGHQLVARVT